MLRQSERIDYLELLNSLPQYQSHRASIFLVLFDVMFIHVHYVGNKTPAFLSAFRIINLNIQNDNPDYFLEILIT